MRLLVRIIAVAAVAWFVATASAGQAPAEMTADQAFEQLRAYDDGQSRKALAWLELHVVRATKDPQAGRQAAERLASVIEDPKVTPAARLFACQQLRFVATQAQVPLLVKMLDKPETVDMARRTLASVPGEAAGEALRAALGRLKGREQIGAVNSLGDRRDAKAVAALAVLLAGSDADVAVAAARALGWIGTADAAAALAKAESDAKLLPAVRDGQLRCAEGLAAAGDKAAAEAIFRRVWTSAPTAAWRVAALAALARACPDKAGPTVAETLGSPDPLLQAAAMQLTRELPGREITLALARRLAGLDPRGQALLVDALAERGDRAAADAVMELIDSKSEVVRASAVGALARLGDASNVDLLARLAATGQGAVQQAARASLERLSGPDVEKRMIVAARNDDPPERIELIRAMAARRTEGATPVLLESAADKDDGLRRAAFDTLAVVGGADGYAKLVALLPAAAGRPEVGAAEKAVLAVGGRIEKPSDRLAPVLAAIGAAPAAAKPSLLRVLGGFGGPEALEAVRPYLKDADPALRDAAVRSLAAWPDGSAAADLLGVARESDNATHRLLALRGYFTLARAVKDEAARLKMLDEVRPIATTTEARKMLLAGLADAADPGALVVASSFLADADVRAEAAAATLKIGKAVAQIDPKAVLAAVQKVLDATKDEAVAKEAEAVRAEALKPRPEQVQLKALQYDKARSEARRKELAGQAPKGYRLVSYLDCGPDVADGAKDGPALRLAGGAVHFWPNADSAAELRFGSIAYDGTQIDFDAAGLNPKRAYQLGFTWWDFDHDTRVQSVWASPAKTRRQVRLVDKTPLPSGAKGEKPQEKSVPIPREVTADGAARLTFRNESTPNAVVSEVWLLESEAESPPPAPAAEKASAAKPKAEKRVLVLTGIEYPGHKWQESAPLLAEEIAKDPRMAVDVVEDPAFLASPKLADYDVIVQNWMNWEKPSPGPEARENFRKFVEGGKGLVLVHFACGAFQDWPEFGKIAGRAYDPKLRGHDPHGTFRVDITQVKHPITEGMKAFETTDELYTCLAGNTPIEVLATARSKVDGKDYPMAFVLNYGKGRVFHSVLGHDAKALSPAGVTELFRRATAWAAGLTPVAK